MSHLRISGPDNNLKGYLYFWAKRVRAVNLDHHCAKCLVGPYDKAFGRDMSINIDLELDHPEGSILYICGVTRPYRWSDNAHLALLIDEDAGSVCLPLVRGQTLTITGAQRLDFNDQRAVAGFSALGSDFTTCRNFQFAVDAFSKGFLPD
jgi:hypothetical protein